MKIGLSALEIHPLYDSVLIAAMGRNERHWLTVRYPRATSNCIRDCTPAAWDAYEIIKKKAGGRQRRFYGKMSGRYQPEITSLLIRVSKLKKFN